MRKGICRRNAMRGVRVAVYLAAAVLAVPAAADGAVAIIEDIPAGSPPVELLTLLNIDDRIELDADDRLIIGYLASCLREEITGPGRLIIGIERSTMQGAVLVRVRQVPCSNTLLADGDKQLPGTVVVRSMPSVAKPGGLAAVPSGRPLFLTDDPAPMLSIERLDREDIIRMIPGDSPLLSFADSAKPLAPGRYRATRGKRHVEFVVTQSKGKSELLERLLRF